MLSFGLESRVQIHTNSQVIFRFIVIDMFLHPCKQEQLKQVKITELPLLLELKKNNNNKKNNLLHLKFSKREKNGGREGILLLRTLFFLILNYLLGNYTGIYRVRWCQLLAAYWQTWSFMQNSKNTYKFQWKGLSFLLGQSMPEWWFSRWSLARFQIRVCVC